MMYDETDGEDGATDEAIADFTMFHDTYLFVRKPGAQGISHIRRPARNLHISKGTAYRLEQGARP